MAQNQNMPVEQKEQTPSMEQTQTMQMEKSMWSKIWPILLTIVITGAFVGGVMYLWQVNSLNNYKQMVKNNCEVAGGNFINNNCEYSEAEESVQAEEKPGPYLYMNEDYGFYLIFQESWGEIVESNTMPATGSKIVKSLRLTSENDLERYVEITVVKVEDKNDPAILSLGDAGFRYLTENSNYAFYYTGGGDYAGAPGLEDQKYFDIAEEVNKIVKTFILN